MTIHIDQTKPSHDDLVAMVLRLKAENEALKAQPKPQPRTLSWKVSEKGAISIYGFGKWPVTLYVEQFDRLMEALPQLRTWVDANRSSLKKKDR